MPLQCLRENVAPANAFGSGRPTAFSVTVISPATLNPSIMCVVQSLIAFLRVLSIVVSHVIKHLQQVNRIIAVLLYVLVGKSC